MKAFRSSKHTLILFLRTILRLKPFSADTVDKRVATHFPDYVKYQFSRKLLTSDLHYVFCRKRCGGKWESSSHIWFGSRERRLWKTINLDGKEA